MKTSPGPGSARRSRARSARVPAGVAVKRSRAGLGLFTTRTFRKGEVVIEYVGRVVSGEEEYTSRSKYLFEVSKNKTIDGRPHMNIAGYINHSCRPNCIPETRRGRVFIEALRKILPGEELSYDYGDEYFNDHIKPVGCRCEKCRGNSRKP